ncbi:hypothetical protein [Tsukamurella hominis]|uniref:hypothetical protein n=1 Tax=Tsukamurella hominis TaxID=1970232 RepID=UPI0039EACDD8
MASTDRTWPLPVLELLGDVHGALDESARRRGPQRPHHRRLRPGSVVRALPVGKDRRILLMVERLPRGMVIGRRVSRSHPGRYLGGEVTALRRDCDVDAECSAIEHAFAEQHPRIEEPAATIPVPAAEPVREGTQIRVVPLGHTHPRIVTVTGLAGDLIVGSTPEGTVVAKIDHCEIIHQPPPAYEDR